MPNVLAEDVLEPNPIRFVQSTGQALTDHLWLFVGFFVKKVLKPTFFGGFDIPIDVHHRTRDDPTIKVHDLDFAWGQDGDSVILQDDHLAGVGEQRRDVAREHIFAVAFA